MTSNKDQYDKLTQIVNENLKSQNLNQLIFEKHDNLKYTIFDYPYSKLLEMDNNSNFLYEVYYKILDRVIDNESYKKLTELLNQKQTNKEAIILSVLNSKERKIKKTSINFDF